MEKKTRVRDKVQVYSGKWNSVLQQQMNVLYSTQMSVIIASENSITKLIEVENCMTW